MENKQVNKEDLKSLMVGPMLNLDTNYFSLDLATEEIKIYSAVVNFKVFKMDIKLAVAVFFKDGKEIA